MTNQKVAIVTGASSRIGRATDIALAHESVRVVLLLGISSQIANHAFAYSSTISYT